MLISFVIVNCNKVKTYVFLSSYNEILSVTKRTSPGMCQSVPHVNAYWFITIIFHVHIFVIISRPRCSHFSNEAYPCAGQLCNP